MADEYPITWGELLDFQSRVVSCRQALGHGMSRDAVSSRSQSGAWQRLHRGTYATFSGVPPREAQLWAAVLRAGPGAVLSHETAAEVHGLIDKPSTMIHVTVSADRNPAKAGTIRGVVVHRSRRVVSQALPPWQLPRTPVAETVLDLVAASASFDDAYSWLSRATGRRLASAGMIREALAARKRMRWRERRGSARRLTMLPTGSCFRWSFVMSAMSSVCTGCPPPGDRHGACSPGAFATWTTSTTRTGYASSLTGGPVTRRSRSGKTPTATMTTCSPATSRRCASGCVTLLSGAARGQRSWPRC